MQINDQGWLEGVQHSPSPNCDARPAGMPIDLLVIHNISLPPGEFAGQDVEAFFTNTLDWHKHPYYQTEIRGMTVSAHLFIRRDGAIVQFVSFLERAWHAGISRFEGRERCNDFSIGIEMQGTDTLPYTDAQYTALAKITRVLMQTYSGITASRITGHSDIAPGRKTDPGASFDWQRYLGML